MVPQPTGLWTVVGAFSDGSYHVYNAFVSQADANAWIAVQNANGLTNLGTLTAAPIYHS